MCWGFARQGSVELAVRASGSPTVATVTWTVGAAATAVTTVPGPAAPQPVDVVPPAAATTDGSSALPATGARLVTPITAGLVLLVSGAVLVVATRRRNLL